jgi:hypothetical protein
VKATTARPAESSTLPAYGRGTGLLRRDDFVKAVRIARDTTIRGRTLPVDLRGYATALRPAAVGAHARVSGSTSPTRAAAQSPATSKKTTIQAAIMGSRMIIVGELRVRWPIPHQLYQIYRHQAQCIGMSSANCVYGQPLRYDPAVMRLD